MAMYSDRNRAMTDRGAYVMGGAGAAMDSQGAASVRGLVDPQGTPQATLNETMGLVHRGDRMVNAAQNELAGQMKAQDDQMKAEYNAAEDQRKEDKADYRWRVEQENKYGGMGMGAGAPVPRSRFGDGSGYAGSGQDAYGNVMPGEQGGAMVAPSGAGAGGMMPSTTRFRNLVNQNATPDDYAQMGGMAPSSTRFRNLPNSNLPVLDSYRTGTPYVPEEGPYMLHEGEAVIPAESNPYAGPSRFGGGDTFGGRSMTPTFGGRAVPELSGPPVAGIVEGALQERAPGFRAPRGEWGDFAATAAPRSRAALPSVKQAAPAAEAAGGEDWSAMYPAVSGLYDQFDVSGMWDDKGGLSGRGQAFRRGIEYGLNPADAARASGFAPRAAKEDKNKEAVYNERLNFWNSKDTDGRAVAQDTFAEMLNEHGADPVEYGLAPDEKSGEVKYNKKFNAAFGRFQRNVIEGKNDDEILPGMNLKMSVEKQALLDSEAKAKAKQYVDVGAPASKELQDIALEKGTEAGVRWADLKARRAASAPSRDPKGTISRGKLSANRLIDKPSPVSKEDPFAGMTREQIQAQYRNGAPDLPMPTSERKPFRLPTEYNERYMPEEAQQSPKVARILPNETFQYAPPSQHQEAIDFVRQYGNTRIGQQVKQQLDRMGIPITLPGDAKVAKAEQTFNRIRQEKQLDGNWSRENDLRMRKQMSPAITQQDQYPSPVVSNDVQTRHVDDAVNKSIARDFEYLLPPEPKKKPRPLFVLPG